MPKGATPKEERQYEHIKESELEQGRPEKDAKRIRGGHCEQGKERTR